MGVDARNDVDDPAQRTCATCSRAIATDWSFCANCGESISPPKEALDRHIATKIEKELAARLKEQSSVVREVADRAEDVVMRRFRNYTVIGGLFLATLGILGYRSISDILGRFQPLLDAAEKRIAGIDDAITKTESKIGTVRQTTERISLEVSEEAQRITARGGEIDRQLKGLDDAASKAQKLGQDYQSRIDRFESSLSLQVQQISKQLDTIAIDQAYPNLGQKTQLTLSNLPWKGKENKPKDELWVDIVISNTGLSSYTPKDLKEIVDGLKTKKFVTFIGPVGTQGALGTIDQLIFLPMTPKVYYFKSTDRQNAESIAALLSGVTSTKVETSEAPLAATVSPSFPEQQQFIYDHSGLDFEIVLSAKPKQ